MKFFKSGRGPAEMPFLDHLEELRWRILWSMIAVTVGAIIGFLLVRHFHLVDLLILPVKPYLDDGRIGFLSMTEPFFITLGLALTIGFLLALPIVAAQFWGFIAPALHQREKRAIVPALYLGLVLFITGAALAYFLVLPMTFKFFSSFETASMRQQLVFGPYISMVVKILLAFGAVFEMPVVVLVLSSLGLITSRFLRAKRRLAFAGSAVAAALLTPGDAISATVFMMGPMILLYELSILLARMMERRRERAALSEPMPEAT